MAKKIPRLLAITGGARLAAWPALATWLDRLAAAGVDGLWLREKTLDDLEVFELARRCREHLSERVSIVVSSRIDVALGAGCQGVHLPVSGLPTAALRRRFGDEVLIGRSTHHPDEVEAARDGGADYVTFGPVWETPSKAVYGPPPGLDGLRRAVAAGLPVVALGGIDGSRLSEVAAVGASGVAGIRVFKDPSALEELARERRRVWPESRGV